MKLRFIITALLGAFGVSMVVAQAQTPSVSQTGTLNVYLNDHPWTTAIRPYLEEYQAKTGVKLNIQVLPESEYRSAVAESLAKGSAGADVFMMTPQQEGNYYLQQGWLENLGPYINDGNATPQSWNFADFYPTTVDSARFDGKVYGIPVQMETTMLFYRKDLFYKHGIRVPKTINQLERAAKIIQAQEGIAGIASRGKGASATSQFTPYLYGLGGTWTNAEGKVDFTQPAFVNAMERYTGMLNKYGPANIADMSWPEITEQFAAGKIGMFTDASVFRNLVDDPENSQVAGNVGFAPFPTGVGGQKPNVLTWTVAMNAKSNKKPQAWRFMQWVSNPQNQVRVLLKDVPVPRQSAWSNPQFRRQDKNPDWTQVQLSQLNTANPQWNPPVVQVGEVREVLGEAIVSALSNEKVTQALQTANEKMQQIINK